MNSSVPFDTTAVPNTTLKVKATVKNFKHFTPVSINFDSAVEPLSIFLGLVRNASQFFCRVGLENSYCNNLIVATKSKKKLSQIFSNFGSAFAKKIH